MMNKVSTLIVGIGGIGSKIASEVSRLISDEDRRHVGFVCIDTEYSDLLHLEKEYVRKIHLYDERSIVTLLNDYPECLKWFPYNRFIMNRGLPEVFYHDRFVSRLLAIASEQSGKYEVLKEEIDRLLINQGDRETCSMTVMIVGTLSGGTGAGLFTQLPLNIRKIIKETKQIDKAVVRGLFLGADIISPLMPSFISNSSVRSNAYACMKELKTFYIPDQESDQEKSAIPYDYLYLLEDDKINNAAGYDLLDGLIDMAAHMVFTLMLTPVRNNTMSVEDNIALNAIAHNEINRCAGIGLTRLFYPVDLAREYVTMCSLRDLISREWLLIDRRYEEMAKKAEEKQGTDAAFEIPKMEEFYQKCFEEERNLGSSLGHLFSETFCCDRDDDVNYPKVSRFVDWIKKQVLEIVHSENLDNLRGKCEFEIIENKRVDEIRAGIIKAMEALEIYKHIAEHTIKWNRYHIANSMFPLSTDSLLIGKDKGYSIYQLLNGIHPVTARYLIYSLIRKLILIKEEKEAEKITLDFEEKDFDPNKEGKQDVLTALEKLSRPSFIYPAKKFIRLQTEFKTEFTQRREQITDYISNRLIIDTCNILISRLRNLASEYEYFFHLIGDRFGYYEKRILDIENSCNSDSPGKTGVYCSQNAFQNMYREFPGKGVGYISEAAGTEIFWHLYDMLCKEDSIFGIELSQQVKERIAPKKESKTNTIFEHAVIDTIRSNVRECGQDTVDLDIRKALAKQFTLETGIREAENQDYDTKLNQYLKMKVEECMYMAAPLLSVDPTTDRENTESVYMAINPCCARKVGNKIDKRATEQSYIDQGSASLDGRRPTILIDEGVNKYELICFKTRYMYPLESLTHYKEDSENEMAYREEMQKRAERKW